MTDPACPPPRLAAPPRKDPQARTPTSLAPPAQRSRAALAMAAAVARGGLWLQICGGCDAATYPPRDACPDCLSGELLWREVSGEGELLAVTTLHTSTEPYFRERMPWRLGTVQLAAGPVLIAHLHGAVSGPGPVRVGAWLDKSGNAVLMALPAEQTPHKETTHMADDPLLRELTVPVIHRRVLVTDARTALGQAVARALRDAGAAEVHLGVATPWLPFDGQDELSEIGAVLPLDLSDGDSVRRAAASIGGKTDILVNTAAHVRPGGVLGRDDPATLRDAFEIEVFGLQRLAQHFAPVLVARGADGVRSAGAFVDVLSVYALANWGPHGAHSAAAAARHSMLQCLRGEMRAGGVRVMSVFAGPVEDAWHQPLPPPKVTPDAIARAVVAALSNGIEESLVGDVARDVATRWARNPKLLERELWS